MLIADVAVEHRMYLPVARINMVQKYIGGDGAAPALDRLGGTAWEKVKARARKSIMAPFLSENTGLSWPPAAARRPVVERFT